MPAKSGREHSPASSVDPLDCIDLETDTTPPPRPAITPKRPFPTSRPQTAERSNKPEPKRRRLTVSLGSGDEDVRPKKASSVSSSSSRGRPVQRRSTKSKSRSKSPVKRTSQHARQLYRSSDLPNESPSPPPDPGHNSVSRLEVGKIKATGAALSAQESIQPATPFDLVPPGKEEDVDGGDWYGNVNAEHTDRISSTLPTPPATSNVLNVLEHQHLALERLPDTPSFPIDPTLNVDIGVDQDVSENRSDEMIPREERVFSMVSPMSDVGDNQVEVKEEPMDLETDKFERRSAPTEDQITIESGGTAEKRNGCDSRGPALSTNDDSLDFTENLTDDTIVDVEGPHESGDLFESDDAAEAIEDGALYIEDSEHAGEASSSLASEKPAVQEEMSAREDDGRAHGQDVTVQKPQSVDETEGDDVEEQHDIEEEKKSAEESESAALREDVTVQKRQAFEEVGNLFVGYQQNIEDEQKLPEADENSAIEEDVSLLEQQTGGEEQNSLVGNQQTGAEEVESGGAVENTQVDEHVTGYEQQVGGIFPDPDSEGRTEAFPSRTGEVSAEHQLDETSHDIVPPKVAEGTDGAVARDREAPAAVEIPVAVATSVDDGYPVLMPLVIESRVLDVESASSTCDNMPARKDDSGGPVPPNDLNVELQAGTITHPTTVQEHLETTSAEGGQPLQEQITATDEAVIGPAPAEEQGESEEAQVSVPGDGMATEYAQNPPEADIPALHMDMQVGETRSQMLLDVDDLPVLNPIEADPVASSPARQEDVTMSEPGIDVEGEEELEPEDHGAMAIEEDEPASVIAASAHTPARDVRADSPPKPKKKPGPKLKTDAKGNPISSTKGAAKKGAKPKGKTMVDNLKASASASSSVKARSASVSESLAASTPTSEPPVETPSPAENGPELFCICRKVFDEDDEEGVMVGCDGCNDWFHPSCIGVLEDDVKLIDMYICAQCEKRTSQRTAYRRVCKRDNCEKSVGSRASKYCSSGCAFQHMAEQIPPTMSNKLLKQMTTAFVGLPRPQSRFKTTHHVANVPTTDLNDDHAPLQAQLEVVDAALQLLSKRQRIFEQAMAQCEPTGGVQANPAAAKSSTKKKGSTRPSTDDRPCGWTERLIWSDEEVSAWDGSPPDVEVPGEEGGEVDLQRGDYCHNPRRRCDRHQGWQKTMPNALDLQQGQLDRRKANLKEQMEQTRQLKEQEQAAEAARQAITGLLAGRSVAVGS